jgi:hypothetical protein
MTFNDLLESVDFVQHRYGWTDDIVLNLPYHRFEQMVVVGRKAEAISNVRTLQAAAFTSWSLLSTAYGYKGSWKKYLKAHGLWIDNELPLTDEEKIEEARKALATAERIKQLDTQRSKV